MLVFSLDGGDEILVEEATDICGVAAAAGGFASSTGTGSLRMNGRVVRFQNLAFDNHLIRIA